MPRFKMAIAMSVYITDHYNIDAPDERSAEIMLNADRDSDTFEDLNDEDRDYLAGMGVTKMAKATFLGTEHGDVHDNSSEVLVVHERPPPSHLVRWSTWANLYPQVPREHIADLVELLTAHGADWSNALAQDIARLQLADLQE
jgi:hypothetical protein